MDTRRKLILFSLALYLMFFFLPYLYEKIYDKDTLNFLFYSHLEPVITLSNSNSWLLLLLHLVAAITMFFRLMYAKYLYLLTVSLSIIIAALSGTTTYTGIDIILLALINISDGIIIYLSFFVGCNNECKPSA